MSKKIALLGVCNSMNTLKEAVTGTDIEIEPYVFQPCFLGITTKSGLNIPYKSFYEAPFIKGKEETAPFTKKTMQFDLNKTALSTIESINPDYLVIDLSTLEMRTYKVTYRGKTVFSCNAYSPLCYENLKSVIDLDIEQVFPTNTDKSRALKELAEYLKLNWNLNKVILYNYKAPDFYKGLDNKYYRYPKDYWGIKQAKLIQERTALLKSYLNNKVKMFDDSNIKIGEGSASEKSRGEKIPSTFHTSLETQQLQGLLFRKNILKTGDVKDTDILRLERALKGLTSE